MTLRIDIEALRARVAERKRQREARAVALRARGVAAFPRRDDPFRTCNDSVQVRNDSVLGRLIPWRRRDD